MSDKSNGQHGMADSVSGGGGRNVTADAGTNNGGTSSTEAARNRTESPGPGGGGPRVGQNDSVQQQFTRFADYFVICGLDLDSGLEPDLFAGDSLHCSPLDSAYKSKPLAHYPEHVAWNPFDAHGICMLSLPQGLRFRTQKHNIEPRFHAFATTREDGKRCYGFSLVFYEEVRNRQICSAMHTLQSMFITEISSSQQPPPGTLRRVKESPVSRSLPRHFKIAAQAPASALSYYDVTKDKLYVAKSLSLVCQVPYAHVAELFLQNLYRCLPRHPGSRLSLESYVYNILYEVSTPPPGKSIRIYIPPEEPHLPPIATILQRPAQKDELPHMDFPLRLLFTYLGVECVIQLFTCVLLESQVLLRSTDYQKLTIVAECITSLLFPFQWPHVYAPILPASLHHFLDAPVPFVMGLHADCDSSFRIGSEANLCYVDIDKKSVQLPEELPSFPYRHDFISEITAVLDKYSVPRDRSLDPPSILSPKNLLKDHDMMTASCTLPSGMHVRRKHSLHDLLDWDRPNSPDLPLPPTAVPARPDVRQRIVDIVRRSGGDEVDSGGGPNEVMPSAKQKQPLSTLEQYYEDLRLNNALREIFLNRFVQMFAAYEHFVILPNQSKDEWLTNRESLHNFDKASFLSDQPQHHRPFLSRFLESQMFATLIDNKIMLSWGDDLNGCPLVDSLNGDMEYSLKLFDSRIKILRKRYGGESMIRTANYEPCILARETQKLLDKRLQAVDMEVAPPSEILDKRAPYYRSFPLLEKSVLNQECVSRGNSLRRVKNGSTKWKVKEISLDGGGNATNNVPGLSKDSDGNKSNRNSANLSGAEISPALLAQANWTFVEKLLKDIKSKTKRMLLEKMGTEAIELGLSGEASVTGVEENTMIASLCDLLEKVWSHGLINKQGKSALWTHLAAYLEIKDCQNPGKHQMDNSYLTPEKARSNSETRYRTLKPPKSGPSVAPGGLHKYHTTIAHKIRRLHKGSGPTGSDTRLYSASSVETVPTSPGRFTNFMLSDVVASFVGMRNGSVANLFSTRSHCDLSSLAIEPQLPPPSPTRGRSKSRERKSLGPEQLRPLPESLEFDIRNILAMTDIKTHIGYARAWVRLALEKKVLSRHLRTLLSDAALLRQLYKRSAFVRCDDEVEQFLYHLLTLNAVDYFCFTNTYPTTKLPYRVVIFPSKKSSAATTSANVWIAISGSLGETQIINVPRHSLEFVFHHKTLGILTSLRIGHDDTGMSSKWLVEHVVIRNEVTGHTYKFPCGRWLGRGIDDGSIERLLIGQLVPRTVDSEELVEACRTPPRTRSPSIQRPEVRPSDIQHMLGDCVNAIVKWHYRPSRDRDASSLTNLLCGENGLVKCLEQAFLCGFRSSRLFGRNFYLWDYFVRVKEQFEICLVEESVETVRGGGGGGTSSSPPTSGSSPESPPQGTTSQLGGGGGVGVAGVALSPVARQELSAVWHCYCHLMDEINNVKQTLGKDGRFQLFICLSLREHLLHRMLVPMACTRVTAEMYEEQSFLRKKGLLTFLRQILEPLDEFHIVLENSITQGIGSHC
ncbi:DENN domain-containing protein 5B isoform X1 [Anopheles merus]|uniref:DENN domain-containing protein 5B isoform X1 n=1 Tax=Anopheles merus TaxID=30066 RepID=UPI001BE43CF4|nr:DENN domain-containing protein 5B isoform X1 [Anopheles merus]XP_041781262.1 DENN domain-containing protein 5B isoform X1 [Anopheles merus]XP_041781263.1 DENN domain-containing protein 5B isoform X1 [Anopheles merus]XP_041781264.1 DENN domain-containing protein 5B isoform X1 [Anopheles merus]